MSDEDRWLRMLGRLTMIAGGSLAVVCGALIVGVARWSPFRTVGVHGMLPENLASLIVAGLLLIPAGLGVAGVVLGFIVSRGGVVGRSAAGVLALGCLWGSFSASTGGPYFAPFAIPLMAFGAISLGVATTRAGDVRRVATVTLVAAGAVMVLSFLAVRATTRARTRASAEMESRQKRLDRAHEEQLAARRRCEAADELSTFCGRVTAIAVSDDGSRIATASFLRPSTRIVLWKREDGRALWHLETDPSDDPYQVLSISPDMSHVLFVTRERGIVIDGWSGKFSRELTFCGDPPALTTPMPFVDFPPSTELVVLRGESVCVHDARTLELVRTMDGARQRVQNVGRPMQPWWDDQLYVWDLASGVKLWEPRFEDRRELLSVRRSPDRSRIYSRHSQDVVRVWDAARREKLHEFTVNGVQQLVPLDSKYTVAVLYDSSNVVDTESGENVRVLTRGRSLVAVAQLAPIAAMALLSFDVDSKPMATIRIRPLSRLVDSNAGPEQ